MVSGVFGKATGNLFLGGPANVSWEQALEGLGAEDAARVPPGLPHSAAQVAAHVQFWQAWLLDAAAGQAPAWPEHASGGWPPPGDWTALRAELLAGQARLRELSRDPDFAAGTTPQGQPWAAMLVNFAGHGAYHLGQVVLVRQALGLWPPPGGGDTW
ncbi:DinB family protein [Deinococcus sp. HMF7604]|uniref:DinB family protein n=1 Tax=Deinococcus betulae TaxID=2873312 RepID=UPI001CCB42FC|nr:DinB family protein [Deinococcus betulae]